MRKILLIVAIAILVQSSSALFAQRPNPSNQDKIKGQDNVPGDKPARKKQQNASGFSAKKSAGDSNAIFDRLDRNSDGKLTSDEVPEPMQRRIAQMDTDNDGSITRKEFTAALLKRMRSSQNADGAQRGPNKAQMNARLKPNREQNAATMIQRLDKNSDGQISIDEAPDHMKDKFARMDANGDGFVDVQELDSAMQRIKQGKTKGRYETDPATTKGQLPKRPPSDG